MYVGQTRSRKLIAELEALGFGECTQRNELPPRRRPWFADNGAFTDWRAQRPFDERAYQRALEQFEALAPDFVVVPDIVAGGMDSLKFSLSWLPRVRAACSAPVYLAVQNGMTPESGLFVGGDLAWKISTTARWAKWAHEFDMPCHMGRCGTGRRVRFAKRCGVDSIDSTLPLWSADNLRRFVDALAPQSQQELFTGDQ